MNIWCQILVYGLWLDTEYVFATLMTACNDSNQNEGTGLYLRSDNFPYSHFLFSLCNEAGWLKGGLATLHHLNRPPSSLLCNAIQWQEAKCHSTLFANWQLSILIFFSCTLPLCCYIGWQRESDCQRREEKDITAMLLLATERHCTASSPYLYFVLKLEEGNTIRYQPGLKERLVFVE